MRWDAPEDGLPAMCAREPADISLPGKRRLDEHVRGVPRRETKKPGLKPGPDEHAY